MFSSSETSDATRTVSLGYASDSGTDADVRSSSSNSRKGGGLVDFILRSVAIVTTCIATIVMAVNRRTISSESLKAASFSLGGGCRYFVTVNAIAFLYASASLPLSILNRRSSSPTSETQSPAITIMDIGTVGFLFSGIGAASTFIVSFAEKSNHCGYFDRFCGNKAAAFLVLTVVSCLGLRSRSI